MKIELQDITPKPFRDLDAFPVQPAKIEALRESYRATGGVWPNIVVRPTGNGKVEQAYGHNRTAAAIEEFGRKHEIEVVPRKLDNSAMLKMMAHDNLEEYGTTAIAPIEMCKAAVEAFAKGLVEFDPPPTSGRPGDIRIAPSFLRNQGDFATADAKSYTATTLSNFLGWKRGGKPTGGTASPKVYMALGALELIEKGILKEKQFVGLSVTQAGVLVDETNSTLKWRERSVTHKATATTKAREVGQAIAKTFRTQKDRGAAAARASRVVDKVDRRPKPKPWVKDFIRDVSVDIFAMLQEKDPIVTKILEIVAVIDDVEKDDRDELHLNLLSLASRAKALAQIVKSGKGVAKRDLHSLLLHA